LSKSYPLRYAVFLLSILACLYSSGQDKAAEEWASGFVDFSNGKRLEAEMRFVVAYREGNLQVRQGRSVHTFSPIKIKRFVYFDSLWERHREFRSIETQYKARRKGSKKIFQELLYEGKEFTLFRRLMPVSKLNGLILPNVGFAIWISGKVEPALFIAKNGDVARQIGKFLENRYKDKNDQYFHYQLDQYYAKVLFGKSRWKDLKKYARKNRLDPRIGGDFIELLKYAEGVTFLYSREETPRQMRK